ncbi:hypothetical protein ABB37_08601 [Leptomonas pyrrhocoris]|uniref:Uncharacterized protein n=1 Tax=Leptomonas pyrrhocoris TaxID=157538 RepID=A0A0N0VDH6_LEPPY|nr:hypothetical protein ABB37_08601 [Leptomonas pyrrhocoris]KPA75301.1 hypothetical protein ABB37_08601 [Leptomonas pyrrhocoris]|eukprot:XP_015653740.1 hypothetical protein ABB37_08601 [Leptomonas pyrrhocoris]
MAATASSVSAAALYQDQVWSALWGVLQQPQHPDSTLRSCSTLQHATTHALMQILSGGAAEPKVTLSTLEGVSSQLLRRADGAPLPTPPGVTAAGQRGVVGPATSGLLPTPSHAAATAVEIERFYVLVCTAIQLSVVTDVPLLISDRAPAVVASGPATATATSAAAQLPVGVTLASSAIVAGIFGVARHLMVDGAAADAASAQHHVQPLWFTFLFIYLQQLSAHTPKDTSGFSRFFENCGKEYARRIAMEPISSDDEDVTALSLSEEGNTNTSHCLSIRPSDARANELAALRAWSQVSADLLKDTIARTRFRRAALLFKSFVPHMTSQAPTLMFLLVDLLCEYHRSWEAWMQGVPHGTLDEQLAEQLAQYSTRSIARDSTTSASSSTQKSKQWEQCRCLIRSFGDRLTLLLGEGTPHAHLVATALCAVLSSLYVLPHTRPAGVCAADVSNRSSNTDSGGSNATPIQSPTAPKPGQATAAGRAATAADAGAGRGRRDEEAAVSEVETAYRLPRRGVLSAAATESASPTAAAAASSLQTIHEDARVCEAEWRLRNYAPLGQLLAYVHVLELQKVHVFCVAAMQMRVGRTEAQQTEHVRLFAVASLYCGVAGWDLALLLWHFAGCPLPPSFRGPDVSPSPALPNSALARYTAAVQQYVDQSRAELIVNTPFVELNGSGFEGGFNGDHRRGGGGDGGGGGRSGRRPAPHQQTERSTIPSRGELQTSRFIKMVNLDPVLLSWRAHRAAAEMAFAATSLTAPAAATASAAQTSSPPPASSTPQRTDAMASGSGSLTPAATASGPIALSTTPPGNTVGSQDALLSPCCFIRDLLVAGQYTLATAGMKYLSKSPLNAGDKDGASSASVNVLLPPRRAFPRSVSVVYYVSVVLRRWLQRWETLRERPPPSSSGDSGDSVGLRDETVAVLHSLFPLLSVVQSYLAHQALLARLAAHLAWLCKVASSSVSTSKESEGAMVALALVERLLIYVVMPCLRVLPPALVVYDALDDIVEVFTRLCHPHPDTYAVIPYGESPAAPFHVMRWLEALLPSPTFVAMYQTKQQQQQQQQQNSNSKDSSRVWAAPALVHPHDALLRKEREALLSQSLKRLNAENIEEYQAALRPILYAEPLLVAHRLFVLAIGYKNNFLTAHTRLLHGLPRTILTLITQQGLLLMERYAAEEKLTDTNGESRTSILATFLSTLWRDNVDVLDGAMLVRRVELALRSNSGHDIVLGTELCKALLTVMAYRTLEHEEKYSAAQLQARAVTPSTTSFFGRGAMTSFRVSCWQDSGSALLLLSPTDVFVTARQALTEALRQPCVVPLQREDEAEEDEMDGYQNEEEGARHGEHVRAGDVETRLSLGQLILVHLCRLQSRIYELQRDLDGGAEVILLSSAQRFNTMDDMLIILEELFPAPTTSSVVDRLCALVRQVALPQVALYVETQQRRKFAALGSVVARTPSLLTAADAVYRVPIPTFTPSDLITTTAAAGTATSVASECSPSVARLLQYFTAAHFEYSPVPYNAARQEWQQCMQKAQRLLSAHRAPSPLATAATSTAAVLSSGGDCARAQRAASIVAWLTTEEKRLDAEELAHRHLLSSSAPARAALLDAFVRDLVPANPADAASVAVADDALIDFAVSYLLPRAVLNLREAAAVAAFFMWAFQHAESTDVSHQQQKQRQPLLRRVTDLALTFVSAAFTYFVAYTDGECKRIGYVLQRLLEIPALSGQRQQRQSVATLSPELFAQLHSLYATANPGEGSAAGTPNGGVKDGKTAAAGPHSPSPNEPRDESGMPGVGAHRNISSAFFSHSFLCASGGSAVRTNDDATAATASSAASAPLPQLPSLLALAVIRGLVEAGTEADAAATAAAAAASTSTQKPEKVSAAASNDSSKASAAADRKTNASRADESPASGASAIPLQLEAYVCRALVQLLTHEHDVPAYAQRNQFLILEQLDKAAFPSTLCAVDLLIRAVEPHASKSKSYYALASAVLKHLRLNRRRRREAQNVVAALSRGEDVSDAASYRTDGPPATPSTVTAAPSVAPSSLRESATACRAQWRLREHYMKQLMQAEVAQLLGDQQLRRHDESEVDEEENEEKEIGSNTSDYGEETAAEDSEVQQQQEDEQQQQKQPSQDRDDEQEVNAEREESGASGVSSLDDEEDGDGASGGEDDSSSGDDGGAEDEEEDSLSGASDEARESEASPVEDDDDDDDASGPRKRPREEDAGEERGER